MIDPTIFRLITELMLLAITLVSLSVFVIMLTFRGKSALDWFLAFRELALFIVASRLFAIVAFDYQTVPGIQALVYSFMALVCLGVFITLIREHVFYQGAPSLRERWKRVRQK